VLGGNALEAGGAHHTSAEYDLTCPRVEGFVELDDARHRVRREKAEVYDHLDINGKEEVCILSRRNDEVLRSSMWRCFLGCVEETPFVREVTRGEDV